MKKAITFSVFWLGLLLCSSRSTDLFHITADEQLAKFQDLFRSLVSEDTKSLSKTIACFVLGNDPDGTDQVVLYDHDSFNERQRLSALVIIRFKQELRTFAMRALT